MNYKKKKLHSYQEAYLFVAPAITAILIFSIYPMFLSIYLAFTKYDGFDVPMFIGITNFIKLIFVDPFFWKSIANTWEIWCKAFLFQLSFALFLSYIYVFVNIKGVSFFRAVFYLPNLIATAIIVQIFNILVLNYPYSVLNITLQEFNFIVEPINFIRDGVFMRNLIAFIVWFMWFGYLAIILNAGMSSISQDYKDASLIDGADDTHFFFYIVLPLIRPTLFYILLTSLVGGMQLFDIPYIFKTGNQETLTVMQYLFQHAFQNNN
ncbi:MAG: carbohydrate ABC transporter permease, partial [Brevinema sp.]